MWSKHSKCVRKVTTGDVQKTKTPKHIHEQKNTRVDSPINGLRDGLYVVT
jgi:hypothetical protein